MLKKIHTIIMSILSIAICAIFAIEVFAATNLNLSISGTVRYTAKDIGADIAGTYQVNTGGGGGDVDYTTLSSVDGLGSVDEYGVFTIAGTGTNYVVNMIGNSDIVFDVLTDTIDLYVIIRNRGARSFLPTVTIDQDTGLLADANYYYIPSSGTNLISLIRSGATASSLNSTIDGFTLGTNYFDFATKNSISNAEIFLAKVTLSIDPSYPVNLLGETFDFLLHINLILDIQYWESTDILSVYHENDVADPVWTKVGYNNTLSASAIKANVTSTSQLTNAYAGRNQNADLTQIDPNLSYQCDDYDNVLIYKDIDVVNVDINTGEIIGKLSDINYPFEWYGGSVTLPAGTTLASGRELVTSETFTVDVYTYYPTVYIRRIVSNNATYISITDQPFNGLGFVKVDAHYVGTCEALTYNPDKTLAYNSYGIIARSYVSGGIPLVKGSNAKMENDMGYSNNSNNTLNSRVDTTPTVMLGFASNLTQQWQDYATNNPSMAPYTQQSVLGVAGQDWHEFVYRVLYIVKYANYSSQTVIGKGNTLSSSSKYFERIGGTITYMVNSKLTYGYNNSTPYYASDFLTYNNGTKRILRDGYVGTDGYTSISLLGKFNPWGNAWLWCFGVSVLTTTSKVAMVYVQFDDYDGTNYVLSRGTNSTTVAEKEQALLNMGYVKLGYNIPYTDGYYRYNGTHQVTLDSNYTVEQNQMLSLISLPISTAQKGSNTTGMCDYFRTRSGTDNVVYTMCVGGGNGETDSGLFVSSSRNYADHLWENIGFRPRLISAN